MSRRKASAAAADTSLALPAELTIYTVAEVQPQWLAWLGPAGHSADEPAVVRAKDVGDIDGAGMQLLLALDRSLAERGRRLRIESPSTALQTGCGAAGLSDWLQERSA
jgi:ABC-type transporter Mla MlaB component